MHHSSTSPRPHGPTGFSSFDLILRRTAPFTSDDGRAFARVSAASPHGYRTLPVRSRAFREWFFAQSYAEYETIPTAHAFSAILYHLEAQAAADPQTRGIRVPRRVDSRSRGSAVETILLDLANFEGQFVEISAAGWNVTAREGAPFETSRPTGSLPNPEPAPPLAPAAEIGPPDGPLQILRSTLNLGPPNGPAWLRCFAWLLNTLRPGGPFPILILRGPSGCGKSLAARALRSLVDPCTSPLTPLPSSTRQLLDLAQHNWILAFDHVSTLSPQLSDALCRLAGGAGLACREPGHREAVQRWIKRPILLTVTDRFTPAPDLAARSLIVTMPELTADARRSERDVLTTLDRNLSLILGALCDAVSLVLRGPHPAHPHSTRHTATLAWALAAAPLLRCTADEVRGAFDASTPRPPLVEAVRCLLGRNPQWTGTATALAELLPLSRNPKVLSEQLKNHALALAEAGVDLAFRRQHGGVRAIQLRASPDLSAIPQSPAPMELTSPPEISPDSGACVTAALAARPFKRAPAAIRIPIDTPV